jgi:uncharacterized protein YjbI with pentapeptide repeats
VSTYIKDVLARHQEWLDSNGESGEKADLSSGILHQADLHKANLERADMKGARLSVSDLMGTNLKDADLSHADLWMSDMKDTVLEGTDLRGANLTEVTNLTSAQVESAITDDSTQLPDDL